MAGEYRVLGIRKSSAVGNVNLVDSPVPKRCNLRGWSVENDVLSGQVHRERNRGAMSRSGGSSEHLISQYSVIEHPKYMAVFSTILSTAL
jgi:hypothetical protein